MVAYLLAGHGVSISRACRAVKLPTSMYYHKPVKDDGETISKLQQLAEKHPTEGQDLYYSRIRQQGLRWNYKRVRRVYLLLGMNRRRKVRRRVPARAKVPLLVPEQAGQMWSMDFMSDVLVNKRKFRPLNIIDDYNREALNVEAAYSMPASRVTQILARTIEEQGKPRCIRVDNGPEFISLEFRDWCGARGITVQYTQPGKPMQNGYIERFNRTFRENILDAYLLEDLDQVQYLADEWMQDYNYNRPHEALGGVTPAYFKKVKCGDMENTSAFPTSPHL